MPKIIQIRTSGFTKEEIKGLKSLKKLTREQYEKLVGDRNNVVYSQTTVERSQRNRTLARQKNLAALKILAAKNPGKVDGLLATRGAAAHSSPFKFMGNSSMIAEVLRTHYKMQDPAVYANLYANLYGDLSRKSQTEVAVAKNLKLLPKPSEVMGASVQVARDSLLRGVRLSDLHITIPALTSVPAGCPASCGLEEGTGTGGDSTNCPVVALNPVGLRAKCSWPLKYYMTCVRNQANRGSCTAFCITAAAEALIAYRYNRWTNLSEQDIYKHLKFEWDPGSDFYGDGSDDSIALIVEMLGLYTYPWERSWDYNPSPNRIGDDNARRYSHSCTLYGDPNCSDTNHQSHLTCYTVDKEVLHEVTTIVRTWVDGFFDWLNGIFSWIDGKYVDEVITKVEKTIEQIEVRIYDTAIPSTSGFRVSSAYPIYTPFTNIDDALTIAQNALRRCKPVAVGLHAVGSFQTAAGGYVIYDAAETSAGDDGHCVLITGYVPNSQVPSGAPPAAGGGYYVVKNSWGTGYGDAGYCYLPVSWVKKWTKSLWVVDSVTAV